MYIENAPFDSDISHSIDTLWYYTFEGHHDKTASIFPDGSLDLIFKKQQGQVRLMMCGVMNQCRYMTHQVGDEFYGVRFKPGYAWAYMAQPIHMTLNKLTLLNDYFRQQYNLLEAINVDDFDLEQFDKLIQNALFEKVDVQKLRTLDRQVALLDTITYGNVGDIAALSGYSRRHFLRYFKAVYGLSPRDFANIKRLNILQTSSDDFQGVPLSDIAIEFGYYDQAHMTRSIKKLTGITPQVFLSQSYNT